MGVVILYLPSVLGYLEVLPYVLKFKKKKKKESILLPVNVSKIVLDEWQTHVDPDQAPHFAASALGLHCLLTHVCPTF